MSSDEGFAAGMRRAVDALDDVTTAADGTYRVGRCGFSNPIEAARYAILAKIRKAKDNG